jgi:putative membrane protein
MLSAALAILVALLHGYFALLEMVLWQKPLGLKTFANTPERAQTMAVLAFNQGLYNLFLSAGLLTSVALPEPQAIAFRYFFLACVLAAGMVGGITVKRTIFFVQGLPALVALLATFIGL